MARRAINIEPLLSSLQYFARDLQRDSVHVLIARFSREENLIGAKLAACDGAVRNGTSGTAVGEKGARPERNVFRLILHVTAAGDSHSPEQGDGEQSRGLREWKANSQLRTPLEDSGCSENRP